MSRRFFITISFLLASVFCSAQDTRGALLPDVKVAVADGSVVVDDLEVGSKIWTWMLGEKPALSKVTAIRRVHTDSYILLKAGKTELGATGSQRVMLSDGSLVRLDTVTVGQKVAGWGPGKLDLTVTDVRVYPANLIAYDLTVEGHRPFLAGGVLVGD